MSAIFGMLGRAGNGFYDFITLEDLQQRRPEAENSPPPLPLFVFQKATRFTAITLAYICLIGSWIMNVLVLVAYIFKFETQSRTLVSISLGGGLIIWLLMMPVFVILLFGLHNNKQCHVRFFLVAMILFIVVEILISGPFVIDMKDLITLVLLVAVQSLLFITVRSEYYRMLQGPT